MLQVEPFLVFVVYWLFKPLNEIKEIFLRISFSDSARRSLLDFGKVSSEEFRVFACFPCAGPF